MQHRVGFKTGDHDIDSNLTPEKTEPDGEL